MGVWQREKWNIYTLQVLISRTIYANFTKISVHATYGRGLILLWQHCNMLCTSGLVDDVIFSIMGRVAQATQVGCISI